MPDSLATWENLQELLRRFPEAPAWGQAGSQEEEDVTDLPKHQKKMKLKDKEKRIAQQGTEQ
jgi:hypothetical protein